MSTNKLKYFEVVTSSIVQASNMTEAQSLANGKRGVQGSVLDTETSVSRLSAADAKSFTA